MFIPVINNIHERGKILFAKRIKKRKKREAEEKTRPDIQHPLLRANGQGQSCKTNWDVWAIKNLFFSQEY